MPKILCLETSTKNCSVSIFDGDKLLCNVEEYNENYSHAEKLHVFIQWALEGAKISVEELDAVCVSKGPGSYTGLRIGVSSAKGLCFALGIPLLSVESLDILAHSVSESQKYDCIIPTLDARRMEVYTAVFDSTLERTKETHAKIIDESSFSTYQDQTLVFIGNAAKKCKDTLHLKKATYFHEIHPSAKNMGQLALKEFKKNNFEDMAYFEPFYLKDFVSNPPKKKH